MPTLPDASVAAPRLVTGLSLAKRSSKARCACHHRSRARPDHRLPARLPARATGSGLRPHGTLPVERRPGGSRLHSVAGILPGDVVVDSNGVCRLRPELARACVDPLAVSSASSGAFREHSALRKRLPTGRGVSRVRPTMGKVASPLETPSNPGVSLGTRQEARSAVSATAYRG